MTTYITRYLRSLKFEVMFPYSEQIIIEILSLNLMKICQLASLNNIVVLNVNES